MSSIAPSDEGFPHAKRMADFLGHVPPLGTPPQDVCDETCQAIEDVVRMIIMGKNGHDMWPRLESVKSYLLLDWATFNKHVAHLEAAGKLVILPSQEETPHYTTRFVSRRVSLPEYADQP